MGEQFRMYGITAYATQQSGPCARLHDLCFPEACVVIQTSECFATIHLISEKTNISFTLDT